MPLLLFVAIGVAGCAGPKTPADVTQASALEAGGEQNEAALAAWQRIAAARCPARRLAATRIAHLDRADDETLRKDDCGIALLRAGQILERLGRAREAAETLESVEREGAGARNAARALAEAARLREEQGEPDRAIADAELAITAHPGESGADDALARWVRITRARKGDLGALRDRFDALGRQLATSELADNLLFAAADLSDKDLGDPAGAIARWDELARRWPRSGLRDDGLWRSAHLLRASPALAAGLTSGVGGPRAALERLHAILITRRTAWITGSYNSIWLDDAQLLSGQILLDDLHDAAEATRFFTVLANDYKESVLRDDALFDLSRARSAASDGPGACAALTRLLREFPDGNRARAARDRATELQCLPTKEAQ